MKDTPDALERSLELLTVLVREDPVLSAELEGSAYEFFGGPIPDRDPATTLQAARRHLEWFLLERHSPSLFGSPVERLLERWRPRAEAENLGETTLRGLQESFTGAFVVTGVAEDGAWLRDLAGLGDYPLSTPGAPLQEGDLMVGRLFPRSDGLHHPSPAMGLFRDAVLTEAVDRDLALAREGGGSKVLHLSQLELEHLFWGAGQEPVPADPVGEARRFLREEGLEADRVEALLARLGRTPPDPERRLPGASDALGEVLDELAFETRIDLDGARERLALAWPALTEAPRTPARRADAGENGRGNDEPDPNAALAAFDTGRAAGQDLDVLFTNLERDLDLEPGTSLDPDELAPAPDFPGVVGAMIEEFRWEVEREGGPEARRRHALLDVLGKYAERLGTFEELDRTELLRFTTFWLPERGELDGPRTRALLDSLEEFCAWAQAEHDVPLARDFAPTLQRLRESLPRVLELNRLLAPPPPEEPGELYEVRVDERGRFAGVVDRAGQPHQARPEPALAQRLRSGDRLRGTISLERVLSVFRCYPPEAGDLTV